MRSIEMGIVQVDYEVDRRCGSCSGPVAVTGHIT